MKHERANFSGLFKSQGKKFQVACFFVSILAILASSTANFAVASGPSSNRVLNYQIRLTNASGIAVADGTKNIKLTFYDAATDGSVIHTDCGTVGSPAARKAVFVGGVASILIGDTTADSTHNCSTDTAPNAIPADLFTNASLYLGVTVEADDEMTPRKRIVAAGYALNADRLDDLETSNDGGTGAYVPVTDTSGLFTLTGTPTSEKAVITANPSSATANALLIDLKNSTSKFKVDAEGDTYIGGTLNLTGNATFAGSLTMNGSSSGAVTIVPATAAGTWTMTLPTSAGTDGYVLKTDGNGMLSWSAPSGTMSSFTLAGSSGTSQTIGDGDTLTIAGGNGISTVASATDTVTASLGDLTSAWNQTGDYAISHAGSLSVLGNATLAGALTYVGGNLGIGISADTHRLSISDDTYFTTAMLTSSVVGGTTLDVSNTSEHASSTGANIHSNYGIGLVVSGADFAISSSGGTNYFAGNVGVGDVSPASLFTVGNGDKFQVDTNGTVGINSAPGSHQLSVIDSSFVSSVDFSSSYSGGTTQNVLKLKLFKD